MKFAPKSEQEIAMSSGDSLWPKGNYSFEVLKAENAKSKSSGADMIHLTLKVYNKEGKSKLVDDYLLEKVAYKLKHFCEAVGLNKHYEKGTLDAADCQGKGGTVKLKIGKPNGDYAAKNEVNDYLTEGDAKEEEKETVAELDIPEENIPF